MGEIVRSLRGRLITIIILLTAASIAAGFVMYRLFQQSATAQVGQAEAAAARACDSIASAYRFYTVDWRGGPPKLYDQTLRNDLSAVVVTALRDKPGFEGGLFDPQLGPLAYAFPTYEGNGPKTDVPQAELPRIRSVNQTALANDRPQLARYDSTSQTLLIAACPLPGPITGLTAWAMTRVHPFGGESYQQLMAGLAVLFGAVIGASFIAAILVLTWSRHIGRIENILSRRGIDDLPHLPQTGERELDRIVAALNDAGERLAISREKTDALSRQVAASERLAMIGRVAAGIAHETRNPIAAMRLKAEVALDREPEQKDEALRVIVDQVDRLDHLVERLLSASEFDPPHLEQVQIKPFLQACASFHRERAGLHHMTIETQAGVDTGSFDPAQMRRALDNLVLNAIQAGSGGIIRLVATKSDESLIFRITDEGNGPPETIRAHLFEPFVTGRPEGTGLGLSIVREIAEGHGGKAQLCVGETVTTFEIEIPWRIS
jgi:signal transduction histidine kinase